MSGKPWWRDPRALPPRTQQARDTPFSAGRVRALRMMMAVSLIIGVTWIAFALILLDRFGSITITFGVVVFLSPFTQALLWSPAQRRQVFGRRT